MQNRLVFPASLVTACLLTGSPAASSPATPHDARAADVTTVSQDTYRTGWDRDEPGLAPARVTSSDFGQRFSAAVDGQVYAQPLVVGKTVVVATENNKVYGLDSATGAITWTRSLGAPWPASTIGCRDLTPNIGVTATPVYDPATGTVHLTSKADDGADAQHPSWYVHALDATTGAERDGWPVKVSGAPVNDPAHPFDAYHAMQRPGLLLMGGSVYAGFASHCGRTPYVGHLLGVDTTTRKTTLWTTESGSGSGKAGIWMSGGGLVSDGPGRILFTTGNGTSPAVGPGSRPPGRLGDSVVRVGVGSDGTMSAQDFFSPSDAPVLDLTDLDLGSGGPAALPDDAFGTPAHPHLLVQIGKDGRLFLLDRDDLGGRSQGAGGTDKVLGTFGPYESVWGHPGVYGGQGGYVYTTGNHGPLRAFRHGVTGTGLPTLTDTGRTAETFGYTSGSPVITSTGTTPGSAVVWVVHSDGASGANGELRAYDAIPANGTLKKLWSAPIGTAAKFSVPATDGGRVYVGTRDGHVLAFGLPTDTAHSEAAPTRGTGHPTTPVTAPRARTTGLRRLRRAHR